MGFDSVYCCRLCASSTDNSIAIFEENQTINFAEKIKDYLHIEIQQTGVNVPRMCESCCQRIKDWDYYVSQVQKVQTIFTVYSDNMITISEKVKELEWIKNENTNFIGDALELIIKSDEEVCKTGRVKVKKKTKREKKHKSMVNTEFSDEDDLPLSNISYDKGSKQTSSVEIMESNSHQIKLKIKNIKDKEDCNFKDEFDDDEFDENHDESEIESADEEEKNEANGHRYSFFVWQCHVCKKLCKNWNVLSKHCKDEHDCNPQVECICGKQLQSRASIMKHRTKHTVGTGYTCDYENCHKKFHRQQLLDIHSLSHLPKEMQPWMCCKCSRRFHTESLLKQHEKVHLPQEEKLVHSCRICQKKFCSKSAVSSHMKAIHFKQRPYVCEQCGHSFTSKGILQEHLTIHSDVYNFHCEECGKSFKTKYRLKIHTDTHMQTKYECPICGLTLNTRRTLRMHLLVHKDEKSHQCATCGKAFKRSKDLKNHHNLHTGRRPYVCPFCMRTFANGSNCRSHKRRMHPEELKLYEASIATGQQPIIFQYETDKDVQSLTLEEATSKLIESPKNNEESIKEEDVKMEDQKVYSPLNLQRRLNEANDTQIVQTITLSNGENITNLAQIAFANQSQGYQYCIPNLYNFQQGSIPAFPGNPFFRQ